MHYKSQNEDDAVKKEVSLLIQKFYDQKVNILTAQQFVAFFYVMVAIGLSMIPSNLLYVHCTLWTKHRTLYALATNTDVLRCRTQSQCVRSKFEWFRFIGILWKVRWFSRIWWSVSDDTSMALLPLVFLVVLLLRCVHALYTHTSLWCSTQRRR